MGIVERELADFELSDGTDCRIERNRNGRIHLHAGDLRIDLTPEEFDHFAAVLADAKRELIDVKALEE